MNTNFRHYQFEDIFTASDDYAARFSGGTGKWLLSLQEKIIIELLANRLSKDCEILDIGGGHGQLITVANILAKKLHIVASHEDAFKFLAAREPQLNVEKKVSDLFNLSCQSGSFELVTSVRLISHCEPWQKLVTEMCRVSSKYVLIDYPPLISSNLLYSLFFPLKKKLEGNTRTFTIFRNSELDAEFGKNGFELVARKGQFFWPMVIHRIVKNVNLSKTLEFLAELIGLTSRLGNPSIVLYSKKN